MEGDLTVCSAEEPEPTHLPPRSVHTEPADQPQAFPSDLYRCLCRGETWLRWLQQAGTEVPALSTFAPAQGVLWGAPAEPGIAPSQPRPQPSPLPSTVARRGEPPLGAIPSRTGSDQEFLVCAQKKGIFLNDVLGLYFPGLTHSLEGKRRV